jgi:hypothetical protein
MVMDKSFLLEKSFSAPKRISVFDSGEVTFVGAFFRSGSSPWAYVANDRDVEVYARPDGEECPFAWDRPFEMLAVIGTDTISLPFRNNHTYPWRKVPLSMQWKEDVPMRGDIDGPVCSSDFHYLGAWSPSAGLTQRDGRDDGRRGIGGVDAEIERIDSSEVKSHALPMLARGERCFAHLPHATSSRLYVFCAHFRFSYQHPVSHKPIVGLRPFGRWRALADKKEEWGAFYPLIVDGKESCPTHMRIRLPNPLWSTSVRRVALPSGLSKSHLTGRFLEDDAGKISYPSMRSALAKLQ